MKNKSNNDNKAGANENDDYFAALADEADNATIENPALADVEEAHGEKNDQDKWYIWLTIYIN